MAQQELLFNTDRDHAMHTQENAADYTDNTPDSLFTIVVKFLADILCCI